MATTLLLSWIVAIPIRMIFSINGLIELDQPVANLAIFVVSIPCTILLRRHWQAVRAWSASVDDRFAAHPGIAIGLYALAGLIFSFGFDHSLGLMAFSTALWSLMGWFTIRRNRYRRGDPSI